MIDDYDTTSELIRKMEASLPIPARPTGALSRVMKAHGVNLARDRELTIKRVFYMGDEGGISCDVTPAGMKEPIICSITQIRIKSKAPLAKEIRTYQTDRKRKLAHVGRGGDPTHFIVEPHKKRKP